MKSVVPTLAAGLALVALPVFAQDSGPVVQQGAEVVGEELIPEQGAVAARDLPIERAWQPGDPIKDIPRRRYPRPGDFTPEPPTGVDPLLDLQAAAPAGVASVDPLLDLAGQGYTGVNPPDTVGDVGGAWYVQSINGGGGALVRIHDKVTGAVVAGPFAMEGLAAGGNCASGLGDPIVLYDRAADRWMLSEFSSSGNNLCIYVSTGNDPTGTYCRYTVTAPGFPDYPKYGVWPDAYYVTTNESSPAIYALDRANMVTCGTARAAQRFTVADLSGFGFQALTPADLDGVDDPPPGAPGIVMRHRDTEAHGPAGLDTIDRLELWNFAVDWATPGNSTLTELPSIDVAEFDSTLCGLTSFYCMAMPGVAQGSSSSLDPLREVVMHRLAYRRLGGDQVLVGNLVTDVGANQGGVRWFELRSTGSFWGLYQEGTYAPDAVNRWMGAIAMDGAGNILLGYNASNGSVHPSLRYTGREATDPPGTMSLAEAALVAGTATNGSNRYGDYAAMSVDPEDDCTFWFTGEYNAGTTWSTRIGSVKFSGCGAPGFTLSASPAGLSICQGDTAQYGHTVGSVAGFDEAVTLGASGHPGGSTASFLPNPVPSLPGSSTLSVGNTGAAPAGSYTITVTGTAAPSGLLRTRDVGLTVYDVAPATPALTTPADGATQVATRPTFVWAAVADATGYSLELDNDASFATPFYTIAVDGTSHTLPLALPRAAQVFWRVTAINPCGAGTASGAYGLTVSDALCWQPNLAIPDDPDVSDTRSIHGFSGSITDLDLVLRATHTYVGDMVFRLVHVDTATTVTVVDRPGSCSGDDFDVLLNDEGTDGTVESACNGTPPAVSGNRTPNSPLSAFDTQSIGGSWRLECSDQAGLDVGNLQEWCLQVTGVVDGLLFADDFEFGSSGRWSAVGD